MVRKVVDYTIVYHRKGQSKKYPSNLIVRAGRRKKAEELAKRKLGNKYVIDSVMRGNIFRGWR